MPASSCRHGHRSSLPSGCRHPAGSFPLLLLVSLVSTLSLLASLPIVAQIDPYPRRLIHVGYNQPLEGRSPLSLYAFYLHNQTNFYRPDWTLRAAVAPVWVDAELGWRQAFGSRTDLGLIAAGGGLARSYQEFQQGEWERHESFYGHGFTVGAAAYHLFNPTQSLPIHGILALTLEGSYFSDTSETAEGFTLPPNHPSPVTRAGLRIGGKEPDLGTPFALEFSTWYEGRHRLDHGPYGWSGDRELEPTSHLFWTRLLARLTTPDQRHDLEFALTAGTSLDADRLSAYRLGGMLPFSSEFPLMIPGYHHQELSSRQFALLSGNYTIAFTPDSPWRFALYGATARISFEDGLEYPNSAHSGVGGGLTWRSPRHDWIITAFYGYGFNALRHDQEGGQMAGLVLQYDFRQEGGWERFLAVPQQSHGLLRLFGR
jgi:hypothetical protein